MRRTAHHLPATALAAGLALAAGVAPAQEAIIYDGDNCTGDYRMLYDDVRDLHEMGFDNAANSFRVTSGFWSFYRDADYRERNGPKLKITGFNPNAHCHGFEEYGASRGIPFPDNRLSAVELIAPVAPFISPPVPVAILYDLTGYRGQYRVLTRTTPDFDDIEFDNDAESVWVIRGTWAFYRNEDYGETSSRPSVTLGPGLYPDIASVPGYPANHFPQDLMSSALPLSN